jgi:hypothetical protein
MRGWNAAHPSRWEDAGKDAEIDNQILFGAGIRGGVSTYEHNII